MKRFREGFKRPLWRRRPGSPRPDFMARGRRPPLVVWALAATAVVVLAIGVADLLALREQAAAESVRIARWEREIKRVAKPRASAAAPRQNPGQPVAWRMADALAHPWRTLFTAIEAAAPREVQWLAFEHDSERPELRLEGIAPDARAALQAVDALATQPGWSAAVLTRLAPGQGDGATEGGSAGARLRFEITARVEPRVRGASPATP